MNTDIIQTLDTEVSQRLAVEPKAKKIALLLITALCVLLISGRTVAQEAELESAEEIAQEVEQEVEQVAQEVEEEAVAGAAEPDKPAADSGAAGIEELTVTGSRIKRTEFSSTAPIEVITTDRSTLAGLLSAEDILQGSSTASGQQLDDSFSGFVTDGGPGNQQVDLRGLGGQRALILVNGRRWGPSGVRGAVSNVDLTSIPSSLISRYEILKDGASSIYGADAVSGVVNIITRESIDGASIDFFVDLPEIGDGNEYGLNGVWGVTGDNFSFQIAAEARKQEEVVSADLDYAECDTRPRLTDQDGDGVRDNSDPVTGEELCFGFIYGFDAFSPFGWSRYDPSLDIPSPNNPNFDPVINGTFGIPSYTTVPATPLDNSGEFYRDERSYGIAQVITETERFNLSLSGQYDFSIAGRTASAFAELYYNRRETRSNGGYFQFFPTVGPQNPTNPWGLFGPIAAFGGFPGLPVGPTYELVDPNNYVEIDRVNFFAGLEGDISADWTYEAVFGASFSDGTYESESFLADRVERSITNAGLVNGALACGPGGPNFDFDPSCVPANLYTRDFMLRGRLPADVRDYLVDNTKGETTYESISFSAYATGPVFDLPAGEVVVVAGMEAREESIDDNPDAQSIAGNLFNRTAAGRTKGEDTIIEFFGELEVPILSKVPGAEEVTLNGSYRWTDYESFGSDTTYRMALNWQVVPWLRLRGTAGTSFRAPDLYEQYLADQTGFGSFLEDPCSNFAANFNPGDVVYDNCVAQGLPTDFGSQGGPGYTVVTGGSQTLLAETSDAFTYGVVLQPEELGFSLAVTAWDIEVKDTVQSLSRTGILGTCYSSINFSSPFCERIAPRDADGFLTEVDASFINIGSFDVNGMDIDWLAEWEFPSFDVSLDVSLVYIDELEAEILGEVSEYEGGLAIPHWSGDLDLNVNWEDWTFGWRMDWVGSSGEEPVFDPGTTNVDRIVDTSNEFYHRLSARYSRGDWRATLTVRNIFDREPPLVADGSGTLTATRVFNTIPGAGYDLLGRSLVLQVRYDLF